MLSGVAKELLVPDQYPNKCLGYRFREVSVRWFENIIFDLDNTLLVSKQRIISLQHANGFKM